ncbi:cytochrome c oxidase subunit 4 [Nakamurella flavida]|uniref:Cytochrome c oxidase polypeptide 4 n=1 Tax=Nakamurella flavida TaxID=363630 RepID=A0A938YNF8_9ACTN|nr:cytochrome c oxidase subunit 4 [Nakamurella flavida]
MLVETWMFLGLTGFFLIAAIIYAVLQWSTEPVGVVALFLTFGLTLIIGTFLRFSSRRLDEARPEDNDDADIADGAGDIGFFSPGSYWPLALAASAAFTAIALAFFLIWMLVIGIGLLLLAVAGLLFEYHRRPAH